MSDTAYDAIVVGARCAGSPTALLLARRGYRVLLVDRAAFPSDTISTHLLHPPAVAALARWGLLDRVIATGCPPIHTYVYDLHELVMSGAPGLPGNSIAYAPRRTVLDKLLLDAAAEAGAEVREGFAVTEILRDGDTVIGIRGIDKASGASVCERARVVIGADGLHSLVAKTVQPERYEEHPHLLVSYYSYWSNLPVDGRSEIYFRGQRGVGLLPTHDDLTLIVIGWPFAEFDANRRDLERSVWQTLEMIPSCAGRVRAARREARFAGASLPNYLHKPYGPGWALVGDAGCVKDSITAQGIADAFHAAEGCAAALDRVFRGEASHKDAMQAFHRERDVHVRPMFDFTCRLARLEPPSPEVAQTLTAMRGNQPAMDAFAQMNAGVITPEQFWSPQRIGAIFAAAAGSSSQ